jgi:hypothetical protein
VELLLTINRDGVLLNYAPETILHFGSKTKVYSAADELSQLIALMMEATRIPEMSVNFYQATRRNIPEDIHLQL